MSTAKVISFNSSEESRRMSVPETLKSAKHIADKKLRALLDNMFNQADDCLFEYADKAANNEQQTNYMDAMRELRIKKTAMQEAFFSDFDRQFAAALQTGNPSAFAASDSGSLAGLSLVDEDDLEESLAITNMANRVYSEFREPLSALVLRLNEVYPRQKFSKESNPFSPEIICKAFSMAVVCLTATLEIKLIVYKLFDKFVVRNLGGIYHEINEMFVAAGVLPTIKYKMPVVKSSVLGPKPAAEPAVEVAHGAPQAAAAPAAAFDAGNLFEAMRQALTHYRGELQPVTGIHPGSGADLMPAGAVAPGSPASGAAAGGGVYYVTSDIISGLSSIQSNTAIASFHGGSHNSGEVIKTKVLQAVQDRGGDEEKSLHNSDADVIDIVSMMFDYILNDKSLPDRTKAVIARMQIPMVKVAILDKSFFNKKTHPARALLNELAYASNILDSEYDDADTLFGEVERIVGRVLHEFDSDVELFATLLAEFQDFLATEMQANKLAEQLILDTKQNVADEIEKRLQRHAVPGAVSRFILGPWKQVMNTIGVRDHCEGIAWNTATMFLDDLIWSVQPKPFGSDRKQLSLVIPRILPALREGMALLEESDFDLPAFLQELQQIHLRALQVSKPAAKPKAREDRDIGREDKNAAASLTDDFLDDILSHDNKHDSFEHDMNDPQLLANPFFEPVRTMQLGTWLEFNTDQGKKRGKLTWKCDFTGEYTFMNRMYKVVADIGMRELIEQLDTGIARIVEDTPLFDRAVNAIVNSVKQMKDAVAQPA